MSELSDAFSELQSVFNEVCGNTQKVKIDGKEYEAIIEEVEYDDIVTAGGEGDDGGFRCMIATTIHPKKPKQGEEIEARGDCKEILSCVNTNGVTWTIVAGNPATE